TDQHRRGRTGNARHAVVLGHPETFEAPALGVLRQVDAAGERRSRRAFLGDGGEIEDGEGNHGHGCTVGGEYTYTSRRWRNNSMHGGHGLCRDLLQTKKAASESGPSR